jgi:hypothetical protein
MLPSSMPHFGKYLALKRLPVATPERGDSIGIVTLKTRTLRPFANSFIDNTREIVKPFDEARFPTTAACTQGTHVCGRNLRLTFNSP